MALLWYQICRVNENALQNYLDFQTNSKRFLSDLFLFKSLQIITVIYLRSISQKSQCDCAMCTSVKTAQNI